MDFGFGKRRNARDACPFGRSDHWGDAVELSSAWKRQDMFRDGHAADATLILHEVESFAPIVGHGFASVESMPDRPDRGAGDLACVFGGEGEVVCLAILGLDEDGPDGGLAQDMVSKVG